MSQSSRIAALLLVGAVVLGSPAAVGAACIVTRQLFVVEESGGIPFRQPADLVLAGERLLVLDDLNGRVAVLDMQGRSVSTIPLPGGKNESYLGVGYGGADELFLSAHALGRIVVLDLQGRVVREFQAGEGGGAPTPTGVLISRSRCFVADNSGHRVRVFSLEGKFESGWGGVGEGRQQFRAPFRLAQDSLDRVLVTDALNSRIQVFTPTGEPLLSFGEFGTTAGTLFRPAGIAVLEGDQILVADNYFGSLQLFDSQGRYAGVLCGPEGRPLALENPVSIAARGRRVFVLEMGGNRVSAYEIGKK